MAGNKILPACAQMQKKERRNTKECGSRQLFFYMKKDHMYFCWKKTLFLVSGVNIFCAKAAAQVIHAGSNKEFMTATSAGEVSAQYETGRLQKALN